MTPPGEQPLESPVYVPSAFLAANVIAIGTNSPDRQENPGHRRILHRGIDEGKFLKVFSNPVRKDRRPDRHGIDVLIGYFEKDPEILSIFFGSIIDPLPQYLVFSFRILRR